MLSRTVVTPRVILPLYGRDVSRYAENCRMNRNKRTSSLIGKFGLLARASLWLAAFALTMPAGGQSAKEQTKGSSNLAHQVRHQLAELPFYSEFDFITFTLDGKKVTLTGQVLRPSLKKRAESAVKSLEGVESVSNQIEVLPSSTTDNELRRAIYRAIYEDPALEGYAVQAVPPIHIIVKDGSVTLEGVVSSASDKTLAGKRAGAVGNVAGVKNDLKVQERQATSE